MVLLHSRQSGFELLDVFEQALEARAFRLQGRHLPFQSFDAVVAVGSLHTVT